MRVAARDSRSWRMADRPGIKKGESLMSVSFMASDGSFRIESSASLMSGESWSFPDMPLM